MYFNITQEFQQNKPIGLRRKSKHENLNNIVIFSYIQDIKVVT